MTIEEIIQTIKNNSRNEGDRIILGDLIELHISEDGKNLDVYKYADLSDVDIEDYDFDADYITTISLK